MATILRCFLQIHLIIGVVMFSLFLWQEYLSVQPLQHSCYTCRYMTRTS
uniref:Uncharacterized protein n=1 Tax=Rhizophora mucronata TaxID=61149 RepID=A0A2P2MYX1_RHIMU